MFEGLAPFCVTTSTNPDVTINGLSTPAPHSSSLPVLLLLHGFPQTHHIWHRITPHLASRYTLIIPDLRGYGTSSKPPTVDAYVKSAMAKDMVILVDKLLGRDAIPFYICAHDRGARVAHKLCVDNPGRVRKAIFLDICPTLAMYAATDQQFATAYFHWFLLIQDAPLPETLISATPAKFADLFLEGRNERRKHIFDSACYEKYVHNLEDPDTLHAMCNDYRAAATLDLKEQREDLRMGNLISCPLRVIWGRRGVIEKCFDAVKEWRAVVEEGVEVDGYAVDSGHYIPEEVPDDVVAAIREFCVQ